MLQETFISNKLIAVLKNDVFREVALCRSWVNRRFGGTYRLHVQGIKSDSGEPASAGGLPALCWDYT
jgi:hypothetical protein